MAMKDYPGFGKIRHMIELIEMTSSIQHEYDAEGVADAVANIENGLVDGFEKLRNLIPNGMLQTREPDDLEKIKSVRPSGPRILLKELPENYREKLEGAMLARIAGCLLGSIVENWPVEELEKWAIETGNNFPPENYWTVARSPLEKRYLVSRQQDYTRDSMAGVPADDDIIYIVSSLMILEKHGFNFKSSDVGDFWHDYLPWIYTDMVYPLNKYKVEGISADHAADDNPYGQLICPYIRIDGYAWVLPGRPEKAADLAYRDAYMSHRRNGVYGAMFFAAAESAAFTVKDPIEAIKIGLTEIPSACELAKCINEALNAKNITSYREARAWVDEHFAGMHKVHTINNACLTVFGLMIGRTDISKVISETVAMGLDNDCNAATAGSIAGAVVGVNNIPEIWTRNFNNRLHTYIKDHEYVFLDNLLTRYIKMAQIGLGF
jgi:ADP-ribosylglycohydrolase